MTYLIPNKMKEEIKILTKPVTIYMKDLLTALIIFLTAWTASSFVHAWLMIPYAVFTIIVTVYLTRPAKDNPGKRKWEAILLMLGRQLSRPWYRSENHTPKGVTKYEKR